MTTTLSRADVVLQDTHGKNTTFSALKGKWVLINYWAGWCTTCVEEIPEFNQFYQQHKKDSVVLFGVNFDSLPPFEQKNLITRLNIHYPNLLADPANDLRLGDITGVPVTFIFNPNGELVKTLFGGQTAKTLEEAIKAG
jgi:thiol-disulfide isomerase/thioredoxin